MYWSLVSDYCEYSGRRGSLKTSNSTSLEGSKNLQLHPTLKLAKY